MTIQMVSTVLLLQCRKGGKKRGEWERERERERVSEREVYDILMKNSVGVKLCDFRITCRSVCVCVRVNIKLQESFCN